VGLPVDALPPPRELGCVGRRVGAIVPNDPADRRDQPVDVLVAEIDEPWIGLTDQIDETDLTGPVQQRRGRGRRPFATGLGASTHAPMVNHNGVISNDAEHDAEHDVEHDTERAATGDERPATA
jgi:hypothetical protein